MTPWAVIRHSLAALVLVVALPLMLTAAALLGHGTALWRAFTGTFWRAYQAARERPCAQVTGAPTTSMRPSPARVTPPTGMISDELAALIVQREEPYVRAGIRRRH